MRVAQEQGKKDAVDDFLASFEVDRILVVAPGD